jgi:hypothetical protein
MEKDYKNPNPNVKHLHAKQLLAKQLLAKRLLASEALGLFSTWALGRIFTRELEEL